MFLASNIYVMTLVSTNWPTHQFQMILKLEIALLSLNKNALKMRFY